MQIGFVLPGGTIHEQVDRAVAAEEAGWDAVFVWEAAYYFDAWSVLSAMAMRTTRIKLGTLLTPLPWRRPWTVAAQAATVDQLSGGRVILSVGMGAIETSRLARHEPTDKRVRGELLDEGLEIIDRLWRGELAFEGKHYTLDAGEGGPPRDLRPVQQPRIPLWVVGMWKRERSIARAARYDGVIPQIADTPEDGLGDAFAEMAAWVRGHPHADGRVPDLIWEGETPADDPAAAAAQVAAWRDRGATWWIESAWTKGLDDVDRRIKAGPPRPA